MLFKRKTKFTLECLTGLEIEFSSTLYVPPRLVLSPHSDVEFLLYAVNIFYYQWSMNKAVSVHDLAE